MQLRNREKKKGEGRGQKESLKRLRGKLMKILCRKVKKLSQ